MITDERIRSFIRSLDPEEDALLRGIEQEAERDAVPIVRQDARELLKLLELLQRPKRLLEVGTATGFSAIYMSRYLPEDAAITTIENYEPRIRQARANLAKAGLERRITLLEGDAAEILPTLEAGYDLIFMDAAKGQYPRFLPELLRLLQPGGILISDNILQDGTVLESRYAVRKRNRTIHSRMREYLYELKHCAELETVILPVGDGMTVSIRRSEKE